MNIRNLNCLYTTGDNAHRLRNESRIYIERFNTVTYGKRSLKYSGSKLWNSIPTIWKDVKNLDEFKNVITKWSCTEINCQNCQEFVYHN